MVSGLVAAAGVALVGLRGLRRESVTAGKPSPVTISLAARDLPSGSDAETPRPTEAPSLTAAPSENGAGRKAAAAVEKNRKRSVRHRARLASRSRDQSRGPTFSKDQDDHGHLAVPLFTQWR